MKLQIDVQLDYWFEASCDVLLHIEVAALAGQRIEASAVTGGRALTRVAAQDGVGTRAWLAAEGRMVVDYTARVTIDRPVHDTAALPRTPLHLLPGEAVQYLLPSRYCPSDRFFDLVDARFAGLEGGARIAVMADWIAGHLAYVRGASTVETSALDTFQTRKGVCRDYAHLMIALARAADTPARYASVYALRASPPDFHAVAEVFLGGEWHIVDPTGMASARDTAIIGIGRDAGDVAFLTAFGPLMMNSQSVRVQEV
ncbi:MAG: transglutaminase family protein [Erythrobacter sp.]|uniref:transglutaminase-like domain-containing protein n=1 Tax=Erythrobacter sp. TaxID=1042 RepID=UPI0025D14B99|nr:transglutaminase family protein [Erythrobacter sp.]MCM0000872.1 transglutaminase family protein [Erythrobacter sp.]